MAHSSEARLPSLDGWRALSILLVLGGHSAVTLNFPTPGKKYFLWWFFDQDLGVRLFFILSGFLITWLLMREKQRRGAVSLKHFYLRRMLRILPVYLVFLLVIKGLEWLTPFREQDGVWLANLTFTRDFLPGGWTTAHLWTLAVEEQFYLLWPGVLALCGFGTKLRPACYGLALPILLAPAARILGHLKWYPESLSPLFLWSSPLLCMDSLAIGCACAVLLAHRRKDMEKGFARYPIQILCLALGLILIPYAFSKLFIMGIFAIPFGDSAEAVGFSILMLWSVVSEDGAFRVLNWRTVRWVGALSYSLYIWQMLFCTDPTIFGLGRVWWMTFPGWLLSTLAVATLSYYGLERPLLGLRSRLRRAE